LNEHPATNLIDLEKRAAELGRARRWPIDAAAEERGRTRMQVAAMIVTAALVGAGWFLVQGLGRAAAVEDCIMSGRSNCMPVAKPVSER